MTTGFTTTVLPPPPMGGSGGGGAGCLGAGTKGIGLAIMDGGSGLTGTIAGTGTMLGGLGNSELPGTISCGDRANR